MGSISRMVCGINIRIPAWQSMADPGGTLQMAERLISNYKGTAYFNDVEWYVEGGRVDFSFTGRAEGDQLVADGMEVPFQTYFVNGMQQMDLTGVYYTEVKGNYGWYGFTRVTGKQRLVLWTDDRLCTFQCK